MNVVGDRGLTTIEPANETGPIPGSSVTWSAPWVDQVSVIGPPGAVTPAEAVRFASGSGGKGGCAPLPSPTLPWISWTRRKLTTSACEDEERAAYALADASPSPPWARIAPSMLEPRLPLRSSGASLPTSHSSAVFMTVPPLANIAGPMSCFLKSP